VFVVAALTIIEAWISAGSPRASLDNIVTFGGAWADYFRDTLNALGLRNPVTALL